MGRPSNFSRMIIERAMRAAAEASVTRHDMLTNVNVSPPAPPTPGALRMRRYRDRRKRGGLLLEIELGPAALDDLVVLRWLDPAKRQDADAVSAAVIRSLAALSAGVRAANRALGKG